MAHPASDTIATASINSTRQTRGDSEQSKFGTQSGSVEQRAGKGMERTVFRRKAQESAANESNCTSVTSHCFVFSFFTNTYHDKIKIIYAAWLRDKTWPTGMQAPDTDEEAQADAPTTDFPETPTQPGPPMVLPQIAPSDVLETASPWMMGLGGVNHVHLD